jgi:hypothetical protein
MPENDDSSFHVQRAISVNANNPDTSFNVEELNQLLASGEWEVVQGYSSTMQAMVLILEKIEPKPQQ